jgi:hypothetical protein
MYYLIITTCINNKFGLQNTETRKQEYLSAITETLSHLPTEITPIIVENNGLRPTYVDGFYHNNKLVPVIYTTNNSRSLENKGMIELLDIKEVIQRIGIKDTDMIIKVTGRYTVKSPAFFKEVLSYPGVDAFVKFFNVYTQKYDPNDSVLGLYAVHSSLLLFWHHLTMNYASPEVAFAKHIRRYATVIREIDRLHLECIFGDTYRQLYV